MTRRPTILVVDDDPDYLSLVTARLTSRGYAVVSAADGRAGLELAQQQPPDLIILDLLLPRLNGYEVCTLLKQDTRYRQIPIIIFSGKTGRKDRDTALACGADAYVAKPYTPEELFKEIGRLLAADAGGNAG